MTYHFRNLIFEGGGIKGIAYVGALEVLRDKGVLKDIRRVGGTSAGAITAVLLALDYNLQEIYDILWTADFKKFMDASWGVIRNTDRLLKDFGWYKGDYFKTWIGNLIQIKTGSQLTTFEELNVMKFSKELFLIGTNLSTGFAQIYSHIHSPKMPVLEAVRISMSLPFFFTAVRNEQHDVCVDGGVLENYPIKLFDRKSYVESHADRTEYYDVYNEKNRLNDRDSYILNLETLGFRLDSYNEIQVFERLEEPKRVEINDFFGYVRRIVTTIMDTQQNRHLHSDDWIRTIYIDTLGIKTTDFAISDERKSALIESGKEGTRKYFQWYEESMQKNKRK